MTHLEPEYPDAAKVSPFFRDFLQKEVPDPVPESRAYEQLVRLMEGVLVLNNIANDQLARDLATAVWTNALGFKGVPK